MKIGLIENWESFVGSAKQWTKEGPNGPNIFRGQSDESWPLTPSLTRLLNERGYNPENARIAELEIMESFQKRYRNKDDHCKMLKPSDLLSWWEVRVT